MRHEIRDLLDADSGMTTLRNDINVAGMTFDDAVAAYYGCGNGAGGNCHIVLDDQNVDDDSLKLCAKQCQSKGDWLGRELMEFLQGWDEVTRHRLLNHVEVTFRVDGTDYTGGCSIDEKLITAMHEGDLPKTTIPHEPSGGVSFVSKTWLVKDDKGNVIDPESAYADKYNGKTLYLCEADAKRPMGIILPNYEARAARKHNCGEDYPVHPCYGCQEDDKEDRLPNSLHSVLRKVADLSLLLSKATHKNLPDADWARARDLSAELAKALDF